MQLKISILFDDFVSIKSSDKVEIQVNENEHYILEPIKLSDSIKLRIVGLFHIPTNELTNNAFNSYQEQICISTVHIKEIKEFFAEHYQESIDKVINLFKVLRWQYNWTSKNNIEIKEIKTEWSLDEQSWIPFIDCPQITGLSVSFINEIQLEKDHIENLLRLQKSEPVYQEMIREAKELKSTNLKSSYVIATAALEVAVKRFVVEKIPESEYLIEEMPSPPIDKLIKKFLPTLENKFQIIDSISSITKIIQRRNKLVHLGRMEFNREEGYNDIKTIEDIIHVIDYFLGHPHSLGFQNVNRLNVQPKE